MNMGENTNFFRESFRGFNKDDVAEYIAKLSKDYAASEEKYKEHIAKLTAELKSRLDGITDPGYEYTPSDTETFDLNEIEQKYKDEINDLTNDLNEKDEKINALQEKLNAAADSGAPPADAADSETVNQLSFQLAASESEKLYVFNLLKKCVSALDIESARGKDIMGAANISDIAPKTTIAGEIEASLGKLVGCREKAADLESENAKLKENLEESYRRNESALATEEEMYKRIMAKLGETVYSANKSADETIAKAQGEAGEIIERAETEAAEIVDKAIAKKDAFAEECRRKTAEIRGKYGFIKEEHEKMHQKYIEISENYELNLSEIESTINVIYDSVSDAGDA